MITSIKDRRVALVGGAGFIGHNLALRLKDMGAEVHVLDGLEVNNLVSLTANVDNVPHPDLSVLVVNERLRLLRAANIAFHLQDARDYHGLSKKLNEIEPQVIVHLAAVSHANRSNKNPFTTFDHSLRTLENALDWARTAPQLERFIFMSSSMVYGHFKEGAVSEDSHCEPLGIYGALKFAGEKLVIAYNQVFKVPYTIVRPSALYGERCVSRRVGQIFIENALFGEDIVVAGDGSDGLDFTYVQDLAHGLICAMENDNAKNQIFNLTYGAARSIGQMVEIIREHFPGIKVRFEKKDSLMPDRGTLKVNKARDLIGYEPSWPLERGYPEYIRWYKELFTAHPELLKKT